MSHELTTLPTSRTTVRLILNGGTVSCGRPLVYFSPTEAAKGVADMISDCHYALTHATMFVSVRDDADKAGVPPRGMPSTALYGSHSSRPSVWLGGDLQVSEAPNELLLELESNLHAFSRKSLRAKRRSCS